MYTLNINKKSHNLNTFVKWCSHNEIQSNTEVYSRVARYENRKLAKVSSKIGHQLAKKNSAFLPLIYQILIISMHFLYENDHWRYL